MLLDRLVRHENPAVKKFALVQLLQVSDARVQRLEEAFVLSTLLDALADPSVYKGTPGEHIEGEVCLTHRFSWRCMQLCARPYSAHGLPYLLSKGCTISTSLLAPCGATR